MADFGNVHNVEKFKRDGDALLRQVIGNFFSAEVELFYYPTNEFFQRFGVNILQAPLRNVYSVGNDIILLVPRMHDNTPNGELAQQIAYLGISITKKQISQYGRIFNILSDAITRRLSDCYKLQFKLLRQYFDDSLITYTIANYFVKGKLSATKVVHLINHFNALRTTSFEGLFFSTGIILTKSPYDYHTNASGRKGTTYALANRVDVLQDNFDRRFWYLVDGKNTFYLCNRKFQICDVLSVKYSPSIVKHVDFLTLRDTLQGSDVMLRIENEKELSIVGSDSVEFIFKENHWKYRDYDYIHNLIQSKINMGLKVYGYLIYYVLYCSKKGISTIIWIPQDLRKINKLLSSKHKILKDSIKITNSDCLATVIRMLSSDGATILSKTGEIKYFGAFVRTQPARKKSLGGTGEGAASVLASNGISIKVSQDGTIKFFISNIGEVITL